jgi:hypothetical protein
VSILDGGFTSTAAGRCAQRPVIPGLLWGARAALEALDIKTRDSG